MNRIAARGLRDRQNRIAVKIALLGRRGTDAVGARGKLHVQRISIGFGIHHHRIDIELAAGTRHAQGDLAAVGN